MGNAVADHFESKAPSPPRFAVLGSGVEEVFVTEGGEHFFGYYDKSPFDAAGRRVLSLGVRFRSDQMPAADDVADVEMWDITTGRKTVVATTRAFNWQQGACLQWLGPAFDSKIVFNDHRNGRYVAVILDLESRRENILPMPVYTITSDGRFAACVNYDRLFWCRPGYSYACGGDPAMDCAVPEGDGISLMDLKTGDTSLTISTKEMTEICPLSSMFTGANYLEHLLFSPDDERLFFMHRWRTSDGDYYTRAYTATRDGSDIRLLSDSGDVSHYAWRDNGTVLLFGSEKAGINAIRKYRMLVNLVLRPFRPVFKMIVRPGSFLEKRVLPCHYHLVDIFTGERTDFSSGKLTMDGHPSFRPGSTSCFVSDTYPDAENLQNLYLYDVDAGAASLLGRFAARLGNRESRCDLHPRWDREGNMICVDSTHTGERQMHVYSLSDTELP